MKRTSNSRRSTLVRMIGALAVSALAAGCASNPPQAATPDESLLVSAGFKVLEAKTQKQKEILASLTPGKISSKERNGVPFFIYPDVAKQQAYVGNPDQYQAFLKLQPQYSPDSQLSSDMEHYLKQDDTMRKYTARDLADPYYFWPEWFAW